MPPPFGIGVPGDLPNGLKPNFTRGISPIDLFPCLHERDTISNCRCTTSSQYNRSISFSGEPMTQSSCLCRVPHH
ncbi:hypothetical protein EJB05_22304, partial [Eragrostis curvula]